MFKEKKSDKWAIILGSSLEVIKSIQVLVSKEVYLSNNEGPLKFELWIIISVCTSR